MDPYLRIAALESDYEELATAYRQEHVALLELQREALELRAEVREWLCTLCNTCYPGPPQEGVKCVICPKCGGDTMSRRRAELSLLKKDLERCKDQLRRIRSVADIAMNSKHLVMGHVLEVIRLICDQQEIAAASPLNAWQTTAEEIKQRFQQPEGKGSGEEST